MKTEIQIWPVVSLISKPCSYKKFLLVLSVWCRLCGSSTLRSVLLARPIWPHTNCVWLYRVESIRRKSRVCVYIMMDRQKTIWTMHSELLKRTMHSLGIFTFYESDDHKVFFFIILRKAYQIVFQFFPFFTSFEGLENSGSGPKITIWPTFT